MLEAALVEASCAEALCHCATFNHSIMQTNAVSLRRGRLDSNPEIQDWIFSTFLRTSTVTVWSYWKISTGMENNRFMSTFDASLDADPAGNNKDSHAWTKGEVYHLEGSDTTGELQVGTNKTKDGLADFDLWCALSPAYIEAAKALEPLWRALDWVTDSMAKQRYDLSQSGPAKCTPRQRRTYTLST